MKISWTEIQQTRLKELAADDADLQPQFDGAAARDKAFQQLEKKLVLVGQGKKLELWAEEMWLAEREQALAESGPAAELPEELMSLTL